MIELQKTSVGSAHFKHRHKSFELRVTADGAFELCMDGVVRKRRERSDLQPQYVWTNIELNWEEHHYVEARYWADTDQLSVTVNGDTLYEGRLETALGMAEGQRSSTL